VAQTGITSFLEWYENPEAQPWVAADVFASAPRELLRSVSLQETLQVIRVVVEVVETRVVGEHPEMREAILGYSRDIAFSAADVYARAAEARGLWDARLEALVVDSIISGESADELASLELGFTADPFILGVVVPGISLAHRSARSAIAAAAVARAANLAKRPILADDLLAERVLLGDQLAKNHAA
jgi:hypothetical protein